MADQKITDLTALSSADLNDADIFPVVDASAGTTKGIRKDNLVPNLTQAQAEDDASGVYGLVSGTRLAQAVAASLPQHQVWTADDGAGGNGIFYDNAVDGDQTSVEIEFDAGYEYKFICVGFTHGDGAVNQALQVQARDSVLSSWVNWISLSIAVGLGVVVNGSACVSPGVTDTIHVGEGSAGYGIVTFGTSQSITKARVRWTNDKTIHTGRIYLFKRRMTYPT